MRKLTYTSPPFSLRGYIAWTEKFDDGSKRTRLEHRVVMEALLGRELGPNEVVHHKDHNRQNNDPTNLEILSRVEHAKQHGKEVSEAATLHLTCIWCLNPFTRMGNEERNNRSQGKEGPFCSKRCVGQWTRSRQLSGQIKGPNLSTEGTSVPHGTRRGYRTYKCRCEACRASNTARARELKQAKQ